MPMLFAKILANQLAASFKHDGVVPLAGFERAVSFVAFARASLNREFLHEFAFREKREQNLDQEKRPNSEIQGPITETTVNSTRKRSLSGLNNLRLG
jgi:hypothetical protein